MGDETQVGLDYEDLVKDVKPGDILVLDDGRIEIKVTSVKGSRIETTVLVGGKLSNNKGLNKRGGGLSAPALTDKDKADLNTAVRLGADFIAVSFVRTEGDMHEARRLLKAVGSDASLVAKIERADLVYDLETLDRVILASEPSWWQGATWESKSATPNW
jgi:pyruvate kinase